MLVNMKKGLDWLKKEFDYVPKVGWMVDSFGHSAANARIFADLGLESVVFARWDPPDKKRRTEEQSLNFLWRPFSTHFGDQKQLLVSLLRNHYCWPAGFAVDERYDSDDPFITNPKYKAFNAISKSNFLINYVQDWANERSETHIMVPWGCDFTYANAKLNYDELEKILPFINRYNEKNITFLQSTPEEYFDALKHENLKYPLKYDDAFPYSDNIDDFWSGFYTSRPTEKKRVKDLSAVAHATNRLFSERVLNEDTTAKEVDEMMKTRSQIEDILSIMLHHDAITGTESQHASDDYRAHALKSIDTSN